MLQLLQFRYSPYNEKVRWALDLERVPHERRSLLPGPHMGRLRRLTGRTTTPVLVADGAAMDGSARIVEWLDATVPRQPLLPSDPAERAQADAICRRFDDDIAPRGRRAALAALLRAPRYFAEVFGAGHPAWVRSAYALIVPLAAPLVRKGNGIAGQASVDDGIAAFREGLDFVAERAAGGGYLVGGRFTVADLTAASVLAVCVDPPGTPMARPLPHARPFDEFLAHFAAHPGAQWVRDIYRRHRGAATDYEGASPWQ
jgi:glutathione S-transferase